MLDDDHANQASDGKASFIKRIKPVNSKDAN